MRIDSSGRLGVATSTPVTYLQVGNGSGSSSNYIWAAGNSTNPPASATYGVLLGSNLSQASSEANIVWGQGVASGQYLGIGKWTGSAYTEQMRIDSSGNLLVGTTTVNVGTATGFRCVTNSGGSQNDRAELGSATSTNSTIGWSMYSTGASAYRFYVGYGGTVYATTTTISAISDIRFKENVRDLDAGLEKIMALKPRLYDWKEGKGANIKNARGFIAQEFEEVFPDLIDEWADPAPEGEDHYKSVRADLIPVLVKAIQEMKAIIDTQASTITQLQADVAALKGASA
jgi:hypothetical protein